MGGGTTPLTKANISKTTPRCSNNYTSYFLLERDVSKFEMLWAFIKIVLRMVTGLSIVSVSCIKQLWFGVFPETFFNLWVMLQVLRVMVQLKNIIKIIFWSTLNFIVPSRIPTPQPSCQRQSPPDRYTLKANPSRFPS